MINLKDFWEMLNEHDWYHMYSDDSRVDRLGATNWNKLLTIASQSEEHGILMEAFRLHHFTGKPWDTEQAPKPKKPE